MRRTLLSLTAIAVGATAAPAAASLQIPPLPNPGSFVRKISNPWFPLRPGTTFRYRGAKDGKRALDVLTVTHLRRAILGVSTTVIHDRLYLNGRLAERTTDWYAQDRHGNVWYLGERTATLDTHGRTLSTEGTWLAGSNGARAGIYMPAHPKPGGTGRQEYFKGHARGPVQSAQPPRPRQEPRRFLAPRPPHPGDHPPRAGNSRPQALRTRRRNHSRANGQGRHREACAVLRQTILISIRANAAVPEP